MKKASGFIILSVFLLSGILPAKTPARQEAFRYFATASPDSEEVRLTILHPSIGSLQALIALRDHGLLQEDRLVVVGLFHEKQAPRYRRAIQFVEEKGLGWIKFHELTGDLTPETLFSENALSRELRKIFALSDGLILFGGADIPPSVYHEKTHLLTRIETPTRSYLDLTVVFHLLGGLQDERFPAFLEKHMGFPVLGICLGMQSLNVGTGGTLVQDIWSEVYNTPFLEDILKLPQQAWHTNPYARLYPGERLRRSHMHPIRLLPQGKFVREWGFSKADTPYVYSSHHQAAERLGKGWTLIATSMDGRVPEAFAHTQYPNVLGIQFHPEKPSLWDPEAKSRLAPDEPEPKSLRTILETTPASLAFHKKIWEWFSRALRQWHQEKGASSSVRTESQRTVNLNF